MHNQVVLICFAFRKSSLIYGISFFLIEIARRFRCHLLMSFRIQSKEAMVSFSIFSVTILSIYYYIFTKRSCGLFVNCSMGLPVISLPSIAVGAYGKYEIRVCVFPPQILPIFYKLSYSKLRIFPSKAAVQRLFFTSVVLNG